MNKIVEIVNITFKNSPEYFKQSIKIEHIKADLLDTFTEEQKTMFEELINEIYKLHNLDIEEYIIHTHKVCKEAFKLRYYV